MIFNLTLIFQLLAGLLPIAVFIYKKNIFNVELVFILSTSFLSSLILDLFYVLKLNNHIIYNAYIILSFTLYFLLYFRLINGLVKKIAILPLPFFLFYTIYELFGNGLLTITFQIENISIIFWSILYFIYSIQEERKDQIFSIINGAIFFYNCTAYILIFLLIKLMSNQLWFVHNFTEGISKIIIAFALWKLPKKI
jgi:hypothetical protein